MSSNYIRKKQLKIAMIGHKVVPSRRGGIELVLTTMCPKMVKRGHQVTCYNRSGDKVENEYVNTVKNGTYKGVKLKKVLTINKKGLAAMTSSFSAAIRVAFGRYDIVHFHAEGPCTALWIPKLFRKRCIVTIHGLDWARDKWKSGFGSKYIKFGEKVAAKYADEIIVLSKGVQDYFKQTYGRDTILIPNGVSRPENVEADLLTKKFGLHKDDYICALSRLTEEKGIHYLIEAYQNVKTDKKLVIAGDTSDTDDYVMKLKKLAGNNPNIIFTGFVSGRTLEELYSNAYVYVLPSKLEGMPLSLLEAMSYGNCVIGSDIAEIADVVEDKAILFKKANVEDLKEKLVIARATSDTDGYVKMLKEMAGDDPNIIFTGFVSGKLLEEIYSNAYVYVLPSKLEGMPLSLLEAMSYGNCVIGSDIAEIADVVEDKAILFKKANVEDLKEKLQMVCDDVELVEKYKNEASGYICGKYNWEDVVNRTVEVYRGKKSCKEKLVENSSVASI